jgi:hypothetical protein
MVFTDDPARARPALRCIRADSPMMSFPDCIEELIYICEIIEIPGMKQKRRDLLTKMFEQYPSECEDLGIYNPNDYQS